MQNCRIQDAEKQHIVVEKPMRSQEVTVWYEFCSGVHYDTMLSNWFLAEIIAEYVDNWLQQGDAT